MQKYSQRNQVLLMQKEFVDIGTLKKCEIKVIYFTDLISNTKQSAIKFEYEVASSYSTDTKPIMTLMKLMG